MAQLSSWINTSFSYQPFHWQNPHLAIWKQLQQVVSHHLNQQHIGHTHRCTSQPITTCPAYLEMQYYPMLLVRCKWLLYQTTTHTSCLLGRFGLYPCSLLLDQEVQVASFTRRSAPLAERRHAYRITQLHHWKGCTPRSLCKYAANHSYCCSNLQQCSFEDRSFQLGHFRNPFRPQREFFESCAKDQLARAKWGYSSCPDLEIRNIQWHDVKVLYSGIGSLNLTP